MSEQEPVRSIDSRNPVIRWSASPLGMGLLFQLCWFGCAYSEALRVWWLGPVMMAGFVGWMSRLFSPRKVLPLALGAGLVGLLLDGGLVRLGVLQFGPLAAGLTSDGLGAESSAVSVPLWMVVLWVGFGTLLLGPLSWMRGRFGVGLIFGALGGPLSYLGGARLGALHLSEPLAMSLLWVGAEWALAMPLLLWLLHLSESRAVSLDAGGG